MDHKNVPSIISDKDRGFEPIKLAIVVEGFKESSVIGDTDPEIDAERKKMFRLMKIYEQVGNISCLS